MKTKVSGKEKRLLIFTTTLSLGFLVLNGIYQWNNRVPDVVIPETPMPKDNALHYYERAAKLYVAPPTKGPAVDTLLETNWRITAPELYSKEYNRLYPLSRKQTFLKRNSKAIMLWREGLKRRYVQRPEREAKGAVDYSSFHQLARLIVIEAHAKVQSGDWNGAADSLIDVIQFGNEVARGGPLLSGLVAGAIRDIGLAEFRKILPHLSVTKKRGLIRKLEANHQSHVSVSETLEEEKRSMQRFILKMTREREFRALFVDVVVSPMESPNPTEEEKQEMLNSVDWPLQVYSAWMNKAHIFYEYSRCMDWQIQRVKKPYPLRTKQWPFPDSSHAYKIDLVWFKNPEFRNAPISFVINEVREASLTTMLALDVYYAEHGKYPQSLNELVPSYLTKVPLDPYTSNQPLRYKPEPIQFLSSLRNKNEKLEQLQALKHQQLIQSSKSLSPVMPALPSIPVILIRQYKTMPYTLYSVGSDSRDNGGIPYEGERYKSNYSHEANHFRYSTRVDFFGAKKCDFVAGINW